MSIEAIVLPCKRISDAARAELHRAGQTIHRGLLWGELKDVEIVELHHFDLLVIGYMGHTALYNRLIGGTTDRLVELARCAVLVVK